MISTFEEFINEAKTGSRSRTKYPKGDLCRKHVGLGSVLSYIAPFLGMKAAELNNLVTIDGDLGLVDKKTGHDIVGWEFNTGTFQQLATVLSNHLGTGNKI